MTPTCKAMVADDGGSMNFQFVRISDPNHPHYPEHGRFTGKIVRLFGTPMAEVALDNCKHGMVGCLVSDRQVTILAETTTEAGA